MKKKKGSVTFATVEVDDTSKTIKIPQGMSLQDALTSLQAQWDKTEQTKVFIEDIPAIPFEGAAALHEALSSLYPDVWETDESIAIRLEVETGNTVTVPWGEFKLPGISGTFQTSVSMDDRERLIFSLIADIKKKHEPDFRNIVEKTKEILKSRRLYKGKAFQVKFRDSHGSTIEFLLPQPIDVSTAVMPLFNDPISARIEAELFSILTQTKKMRKFGIPRKRGVLLAAKYGMGKTMLGKFVAKVAIENGWTFIYVPSASELPDAYGLAREYQPAVVFVEDINRAVGQNRTSHVDRILNTLDGVDSKDDEIIVVMTTNDPDQIHEALLRPGRVDSIIRIDSFDQQTVVKFLKDYIGVSLAPNTNLSNVAKKLSGQTGARIVHVVNQAKLYAMLHLENTLTINEEDLLKAVDGVIQDARLIDEEQELAGGSFSTLIHQLLQTMSNGHGGIEISLVSGAPNGSKKETVH